MRCVIAILLGFAAGGAEAARAARPPILSVSPLSLTFNAPEGGPNPGPQTITISNTGNGNMPWTITFNETWLDVQPASGNLATNKSIDVTVLVDVVNPTMLTEAGSPYSDTITVDAMAAGVQGVSVTLNVSSTPVLDVSPPTLSYSAPEGGPNPASQPVTVTNAGGGTLNWTATSGASWLNLDRTSGSLSAGASDTIMVSVDVVGPPPLTASGSPYAGAITVDAGAAGSQVVNVMLTVSSTPVLDVSVSTLSFSAPEGGPNPPAQPVTVTNAGGGTLNWTASTGGATWLNLSLTSGSLGAGMSDTINVSVDVLNPVVLTEAGGPYNETITITAAGASGSPATVDVDLDVSAAPVITLNPTMLTFNAPQSGMNPSAQSVSVLNSGAGTLNWTATDNATWLSENPTSGSLAPGVPEAVTVFVDVAGLGGGTYTGTIQITDGAATNSPQIVFVTLNVPFPLPKVTIVAGQCGSTGAEILIPLLLLALRRRRGGRS